LKEEPLDRKLEKGELALKVAMDLTQDNYAVCVYTHTRAYLYFIFCDEKCTHSVQACVKFVGHTSEFCAVITFVIHTVHTQSAGTFTGN